MQKSGRHVYIKDEDFVVSTQFSVVEFHAYAETDGQKFQLNVRYIFTGRILSGLATSWSTYIPHTHAGIAAILGHWTRLLVLLFGRCSATIFSGGGD